MESIIKEKIDTGLYLRAMEFNPEKADSILDTIQEAWDNGESFLADDMLDMLIGTQREPGNEEQELQAAVAEAEKALRWKIVIPTSIGRLQRADTVSLCNTLVEMDAVLALCGEQLTAREIADLWDEQHPDEKLVRAPGFEL